jgi:hypothetical protein
MLARQSRIQTQPNSIQSKYAKTAEAKDYLGSILPFPKGTTSGQSNQVRQKEKKE